MASPITVVIVNDYEVVVRGLAAQLEGFPDRVRVVEVAVDTLPSEDSDIVLYDTFAAVPSRKMDFVQTLAEYRGSRLVIYTWQVSQALRDLTLAGGVSGYVSKTLTASQLVQKLEDVHAGRLVDFEAGEILPPDDGVQRDGDWPGRDEGLSERESEIVALIVLGLSNEQVANRAYLSINTVKSYIRTAYRKMEVTSRSQALLWGIDHGFRLAERTPTTRGRDDAL